MAKCCQFAGAIQIDSIRLPHQRSVTHRETQMKQICTALTTCMWVFSQMCIAATPQRPPAVRLQLVVEGLNAPLFLVAPNDGSGRRIVGDQIGLAMVLMPDGKLAEKPFLDLRKDLTPLLKAFDERGLLALAFHPDFARNGLFYVNYSAKRRAGSPFTGKTAYTWRTSEFKVSDSSGSGRPSESSGSGRPSEHRGKVVLRVRSSK